MTSSPGANRGAAPALTAQPLPTQMPSPAGVSAPATAASVAFRILYQRMRSVVTPQGSRTCSGGDGV